MLLNFGGNARSRPRVNLGGHRQVSREDLLKKAAADRIRREELRRRENASRMIQKQWRIWQIRREVMNDLRRQFDECCVPDDPAQAYEHLDLFLYFFNPRQDSQRVLFMAVHACILNLNLTLDCHSVLRLQQSLIETYMVSNLEEAHVMILLRALQIINRLYECHIFYLDPGAAEEYYKFITSDLRRSCAGGVPVEHMRVLIECMITPLIRAEDSREDLSRNRVYSAFIYSVLDCPEFRKVAEAVQACDTLSLDALINACLRKSGRPENVGDGKDLIYNVILITKNRIGTASRPIQLDWMEQLSIWMDNIFPILSPGHSDETLTADENPLEAPHNHAFLRIMLDDTLTVQFSRYVLSLLHSSVSIREAVLLQLTLIATDPNAGINLLSEAYKMWQPMSEWGRYHGLCFFLEVFSRTLLTMVDDEFFDSAKNPVPLSLIRRTALRLKEIAVLAYLTPQSMNEDTGTHEYLQNLISKVLQQIQIRDARQQFLEKGLLIHHSAIPLANIVALVASEAFPQDGDDEEEGEEEPKTTRPSTTQLVKMITACPFFVPFLTRVEILQTLVERDMATRGLNDFQGFVPKHSVVCRRGFEFEDGFQSLWHIGSGLKGSLAVDYRDVHGIAEAGIDGGGLTKEFLTYICQQAFHPDFGLFVETSERLLYPNPSSSARTLERLQKYEFLGRIIAKCIYDDILVDVAFAPSFLLSWIGKLAYIDDLKAMDKDLYRGLIQLKNYKGDVENDFALDFTVNEEDSGVQRIINLVPNGSEVPVTNTNRLRYLQLVCHFKLNSRISQQSQAFVRGLSDILDLRWLSLFNQNELQSVVGGAPVPIDISDLEQNTVYGGFDTDDLTVRIFWDVLREFDNEEKRKLLKFVTSTPRPPLLGFGVLQPKFSLRNAGNDLQRLPTASTCVNLLKLPAYQSHEQMRHKLRLSISAEAGFDLS